MAETKVKVLALAYPWPEMIMPPDHFVVYQGSDPAAALDAAAACFTAGLYPLIQGSVQAEAERRVAQIAAQFG